MSDDSEALERFKDEQMMRSLEEGWFNAHYAWLFRDKVRPPDPVAEEVAQWLKFNPETGMFDSTEDLIPFKRGAAEAHKSSTHYDGELFEQIEWMRAFDKVMGGFFDDADYRQREWRAW